MNKYIDDLELVKIKSRLESLESFKYFIIVILILVGLYLLGHFFYSWGYDAGFLDKAFAGLR